MITTMFGPVNGALTATPHNAALEQMNKDKICFEFIVRNPIDAT